MKRGLVLYLDPDTLLKHGARCVDDPAFWVRDRHFFVCSDVDRDTGEGLWWPLYSGPSDHRRELGGIRFGADFWVGGTFYWSPRQAWWATESAVRAAAPDDGTHNLVVEFDEPSRRILDGKNRTMRAA